MLHLSNQTCLESEQLAVAYTERGISPCGYFTVMLKFREFLHPINLYPLPTTVSMYPSPILYRIWQMTLGTTAPPSPDAFHTAVYICSLENTQFGCFASISSSTVSNILLKIRSSESEKAITTTFPILHHLLMSVLLFLCKKKDSSFILPVLKHKCTHLPKSARQECSLHPAFSR